MITPGLTYTAAVTILAALLFFYMGINVARMRGKHGVKAPAMTGHPEFERALRVQMNTVEGALMFLPALWVAAIWFGGWIPAAAGLVWVIGRVVYLVGYMAAPEKREAGFFIQSVAVIALVVLSAWGIGQALMAM